MSSRNDQLLIALATLTLITACADRPADPPATAGVAAAAPAAPPDTSTQSAVEVLRRYFVAIDARDYAAAYALWASGGAASGQTLEEFAAGFAQTERVRAEIGELSKVVRVVKVGGYVASTPDFTGQPGVVNGASDLLVRVFGDAGVHARAAVGVAALPLDAPVEVEMIVEVR